jgi:peptidoglycan/LPS O-acetylase OafA/YrhL
MQSYTDSGIKNAQQRAVETLSSKRSNASDNPGADSEIPLARKIKRIAALDFTKGALVLVMVVYHWLNYFVMSDGSVYKYLRFLTPSFTFITGFLISQVYLSKYSASGRNVTTRLTVRGIKLLAIALCLNLAIGAAGLKSLSTRASAGPSGNTTTAYLIGTAPVAFSVLVPIAYLLIFSAGLLSFSQDFRYIYHAACVVFIGWAFFLQLEGISCGYLQLFSIGLLGVSVGYVPIERINRLTEKPLTIFVAYLAYLLAITLYDDIYPLQIVGVCLSLVIIYSIGIRSAETTRIGGIAVQLGQYSLFGYIVQILILQVLRRSLSLFGLGNAVSVFAFVICLACTILSVEALDRARNKSAGLNKVYTAVFS